MPTTERESFDRLVEGDLRQQRAAAVAEPMPDACDGQPHRLCQRPVAYERAQLRRELVRQTLARWPPQFGASTTCRHLELPSGVDVALAAPQGQPIPQQVQLARVVVGARQLHRVDRVLTPGPGQRRHGKIGRNVVFRLDFARDFDHESVVPGGNVSTVSSVLIKPRG